MEHTYTTKLFFVAEMEISDHPVFHLVAIWVQTNTAHTVAESAQCQRLGLTPT